MSNETPEVTETETPEVTETETDTTQETAEEPETATAEEPEDKGELGGLDAFFDEFSENGSLSEESYAALAERGFGKALVDSYIASQSDLLTDADADALIEKVGGAEKYQALNEWARENLSPEDLADYNASLARKATAKVSVEWLHAKMRDAEGFEPETVLNGETDPKPTADTYKTKADVTKAMRDPRYGKDKAYTREVEDKVARSRLF